MNKNLITPNRKELTWGLRYLLFQAIFLGSLIVLAARLFGIAINATWLNIIYFTVNFVAVVLLCRRYLRNTMAWGLQSLGRNLGLAAGGFLVYQTASVMLAMVIVMVQPDFGNVNDQALSAMSQDNFALMAFCTVLLVPLTEEILYRGIVFGGLYFRNRWLAYGVSVLVFSLIHVSGYIGSADPLTLLLCFSQYIPAGLCLAFVYERSGSLLPSVLIHTAVNAIGMLAMR